MNSIFSLLKNTSIANDCWTWTAGKNRLGYGRTFHGLAHRQMYEYLVGPIPDGMSVCHSCDNPSCVNPCHLFLGSHAENMADMARKGRAGRLAGEDSPSAKLTAADVLFIRSSPLSNKVLAERFGITSARVGQLKRGIGWTAIRVA